MNIILKGWYDAAVLQAETSIPPIRPGGKYVSRHPKVLWEDATEEMRKDSKRVWFTSLMFPKFTFRKHTEEEKEELRLNQEWRANEIVKYLSNYYGWSYAEQYAQEHNDIVKVELRIPHCRGMENAQCDLFCPYFKGYCIYQEED